MRKLILILLLLLTLPSTAHATIPRCTGLVNDYANMLSFEGKAGLSDMLAMYKKESKTSIVVLTVPSIDNEKPERYLKLVVSKWIMSHGSKSPAALLLVSGKEDKIWIYPMVGLRDKLNGKVILSIGKHIIRFYFNQGHYDDGIILGARAMIDAVEGTYKVTEINDDPPELSFFERLTLMLQFFFKSL